ncbi:MAG: hypothetical protein HYX75_13545 [Acidobacteria bacterium]|nr:hypothetical protein [Acidobacteriota bacterium]
MRPVSILLRRAGRCLIATTPWLVFSLAPQSIVLALDPDVPIRSYLHRTWQKENGLPHLTVSAMAQTRDGYLWLGTPGGLIRFDGMRFTLFENFAGLAEKSVWTLLADEDGGLWIGLKVGGLVYRSKEGASTAYTVSNGLASNRIRCLHKDRLGTLWIGTDDAGLAAFAGGRFSSFTAREGLGAKRVRCLREDESGNLWLGSDGGVLYCRSKDGRFTAFEASGKPRGLAVESLAENSDGGLWVGFRGGGVALFRDGRWFSPPKPLEAIAGETVRVIFKDHDGNQWFATEAGLGRLTAGRFEIFRPRDGLSNDWVLSLFEDRQGTLWAGTLIGLNQFLNTGFSSMTTADGSPDAAVICVHEGRKGDLWLGTMRGLARVAPNGRTILEPSGAHLPKEFIIAVREDSQGALWLGTWASGVTRVKDGVVRTFTVADGLASDLIRCLSEDREGSLWIGATEGGLTRLRDGHAEVFTNPSGLRSNLVGSVRQCRDGSLWVATYEAGLNRLSAGRWSSFGPAEGFHAKRPQELYEDSEGDLWIPTEGDGLYRLKNGRFSAASQREGLPDSIFGVLEDTEGRLWMASDRGVLSAPKRDIESVLSGRLGSVTCTTYGPADGMSTADGVGGGTPPVWKTRDGRLVIPNVRGVTIIDPTRVRKEQPPRMAIEEVTVDGASFDGRAASLLPAGSGRLQIRYTAVTFVDPAAVRFKYRLEGFDKDWVDAGPRREATYTSLPPRNFCFRVVACNKEGAWSATSAEWRFGVEPFFYQRPVFYALCVLAAGTLVLGLHRLRLRELLTRNAVLRERSRVATEIHDTLAQVLTGLRLHLARVDELVPENADDARSHLAVARELARTCSEETRRAVNALRPRALVAGPFPEALRSMAETLASAAGMDVSLEVRGEPHLLSEAAEHDLWHIAQEAVTNAVRHSRGRHVRLFLGYERHLVRLCVSDDGTGILAPPTADSSGSLGLAGMLQRSLKRRVRVRIETPIGGGTNVYAEVHLDWIARWFSRRPRVMAWEK